MKTFRTNKGPFSERPHYTPAEIESICSDELRQAGYFPDQPEPVRIDRFLEKRFRIMIEYADLGKGVLGYTRFGSKGPSSVVISRALDEEGTVVGNRRIRTTLAHEVGHILLQGHLFSLEGQGSSLFPGESEITPMQVLCRTDATTSGPRPGYGYEGKWWEYQANRAIGSLLLPRSLVLMVLEPLLSEMGSLGAKSLDSTNRSRAEAVLAEAFNVNPIVGKLRLEEIWPAAQDKQMRL